MNLLAEMKPHQNEMANQPIKTKRKARIRLMMALGFHTGRRISDILSLTWAELASGIITLKEKKTGKISTIPFSGELKQIIQETFKVVFPLHTHIEDLNERLKHQPFFVSTRGPKSGNKAISTISANAAIKETFLRYGIKSANPSSHTLRKTFGRRVYEKQGKTHEALLLLADIFNHSSTKETRRYIGLTEEMIRDVYQNIAKGGLT